jgi:hypothetical protein
MPQLDSLTFFSQFFWFSFFFLGFYILLVKYYLPKMSRLIKVRSLKVSSGSLQDTLTHSQEKKNVSQSGEDFLLQGLSSSKQFFQESFQKTSAWVLDIVELTNKGSFQKMNQMYLSTLGNGFSSQTLFLNQFKNLVAPRSFSLWTKDLQNLKGSMKGSSSFSSQNRQEKLYTFRLFKRISRSGK